MSILAGQIIHAADLSPEAWQPIEFTANESSDWHNYGDGWSDAQFRRHPLEGTLEIRGTIVGTRLVNAVPITFMPAGYRPASNVAFGVNASTTTAGGTCTLRVFSEGGMRLYGAGSLGQSPLVLSLDGIRYYTG